MVDNIVITLGTDGYWTYHDDHFVMYANVKSLYSTPETNNNVHQLYFNLKSFFNTL